MVFVPWVVFVLQAALLLQELLAGLEALPHPVAWDLCSQDFLDRLKRFLCESPAECCPIRLSRKLSLDRRLEPVAAVAEVAVVAEAAVVAEVVPAAEAAVLADHY